MRRWTPNMNALRRFEVVGTEQKGDRLVVRVRFGLTKSIGNYDGAAVVEYKDDLGWKLAKATGLYKPVDAGGFVEDVLKAANCSK